ncbi:glutamate cyclase domain-containing protein [Okeania sp.]|uniref:glutamate cyclase domain-containing protein n=1 Tax=Okeania sp. TaxID=3100323 RepID=UPI002B4AF038|nr:glutamate cyclase domain-containing protein [Okeania sp.]MEB3339266.1 glutamate cyclase domain-containing protein [Okeania sp.]
MNILSENSPEVLTQIEKIENICGRDIGHGIQPLVEAAKGGLLGAARSIAEHPSPHVAIMTGFFIPHGTPPAAENDGPIGCAHLAAGLERVGIPVRLVTDPLCLKSVETAARAAGISPNVAYDVVPVDAVSREDASVAEIIKLWKSAAPPVSHVIAIERAGPSADGTVRNVSGKDITAHTAPLHLLFTLSEIISIGIGDLGNELGMATLSPELIAKTIKRGEIIACNIPCNYPIICGVSNWGAMGLLIALALLRPDWKESLTKGLTLEMDKQILTTLVNEEAAIDGDTGLPGFTIETFPWEFHGKVLAELLEVAKT